MKQSESIHVLFRRFFTYLSLSAVFILLGLSIGIIGYHFTVGLSWVDALVEASMILSGMGPISKPD
jgi:cytochrome c biogenesis protein CcdA